MLPVEANLCWRMLVFWLSVGSVVLVRSWSVHWRVDIAFVNWCAVSCIHIPRIMRAIKVVLLVDQIGVRLCWCLMVCDLYVVWHFHSYLGDCFYEQCCLAMVWIALRIYSQSVQRCLMVPCLDVVAYWHRHSHYQCECCCCCWCLLLLCVTNRRCLMRARHSHRCVARLEIPMPIGFEQSMFVCFCLC